jgi:tetratricopeptide (TPR) repeat protein
LEDRHFSADLFRRFLAGNVSRSGAARIVGHLIRGCDDCSELAQRLVAEAGAWSPKSAATRPAISAYNGVVEHAVDLATPDRRHVAVERLLGWVRWASLALLSPQERTLRLRSDPSLCTRGFHQRLLELYRGYLRSEPTTAVRVVELAVLVAERIPLPKEGRGARAALLAETWAHLGNAKRMAYDYGGARAAFDEAWKHVGQGQGTVQCVLSLEASLLTDLGEFEIAETALEEALLLYRGAQDHHQEGRILIQMAAAIGEVVPERALDHLYKALPLIDAKVEPRLPLCAWHNIAWFLTSLGKGGEALAVLDENRLVYRQFPDAWTQLRLHWLEGRIAQAIGRSREATEIFRLLRADRQVPACHRVLVSLDLAESLVALGDFDAAGKIAREVHPKMASWGLHREAQRAVKLLGGTPMQDH